MSILRGWTELVGRIKETGHKTPTAELKRILRQLDKGFKNLDSSQLQFASSVETPTIKGESFFRYCQDPIGADGDTRNPRVMQREMGLAAEPRPEPSHTRCYDWQSMGALVIVSFCPSATVGTEKVPVGAIRAFLNTDRRMNHLDFFRVGDRYIVSGIDKNTPGVLGSLQDPFVKGVVSELQITSEVVSHGLISFLEAQSRSRPRDADASKAAEKLSDFLYQPLARIITSLS